MGQLREAVAAASDPVAIAFEERVMTNRCRHAARGMPPHSLCTHKFAYAPECCSLCYGHSAPDLKRPIA